MRLLFACFFQFLLLLHSWHGEAKSLPEFQLDGLNAPDLKSKDLRGQPLVIQFWASWCQSCGGVSDDLGQLMKSSSVKVLSVSLDETKQKALNKVKHIKSSTLQNQTFYFDKDRRFADELGSIGVPTVLVVDAKGNIVSRISGHWGTAQRQELTSVLANL